MSDENAQQEFIQKKVAFYQSFLSAWIENRMEKDKQILILSALAIGLLMTFRDELPDVFSFCLWLLSGFAFVIAIIIVLWIFRQNSDYIELLLINDDDQSEEIKKLEKSLQKKTLWAFGLFILGIVLTISLAIYGSYPH